MVIACSGQGLLSALRRPGLIVVLWVWNLLFAAVIAVPTWRWWYGSTAWSPEADVFLSRFNMGVMVELLRNNPVLDVVMTTGLVLAVVAFIGQAFVAGGMIEVLTSDDARPLLHRFFRGAGHFFSRFLRAAVVATLAFLVAAAIVLMVARPLGRMLEELDWEPAWYLGQVATLLIIGLVALVVILALDYARICMVREDSRRALRAFVAGLAFVAGRPGATVGLWFIIAVATAIVFALYLAFCTIAPATSWASILLALTAQQVTILVRAELRVALVAGEIQVWTRLAPGPQSAGTPSQLSAAGAGPPREASESPVSGVEG